MEHDTECCSQRADTYEFVAVSDLDWLAPRAEKVSVDYKQWITTYRCTHCGQLWQERYRTAGHANIPDVIKVEQDNVA